MRRLQAGRSKQHINPLFLCECLSAAEEFVDIQIRHLNWLQIPHNKWRAFRIFLIEIFQRDDAPNSTNKELLKFLHIAGVYLDTLHTKVRQERLVHVSSFV